MHSLVSTSMILDLCCLQVDEITARTRAIWTSGLYLQNSFAPVNRIPPEVLGLIPSSLPSKRDLINATAVCRHWRATLLSSPDLWCNIECSGRRGYLRERMFRECLGRSGTVPLNIRLTSARYLPDITPHLARFSTLEIVVVAPEQPEKIAACFSKPAPILRRLIISGAAPWTRVGLSIPPGLFGGDFTSLRTLRLVGFSFMKLPQHFPQLTRFDLEGHADTPLRTDAMLGALERMPSLEVLHVKFYLGYQPPLPPTFAPRLVALPKLREVKLAPFNDHFCPPEFVPHLLSALTLPSVEQVLIGVLPPAGGATLPSSFEEQLPSLAETATVELRVDPEVFSLLFHGLRGSRLLFTTRRNRPRFQSEGFRGTPFLSVKKMVVTLNVVCNLSLEAYLFGLLRAMGRLESLEISGWCAGLLCLWSQKVDQRSVCPSLRSVVVMRGSSNSASELLTKLATARKAHGVPLVEAVVLS